MSSENLDQVSSSVPQSTAGATPSTAASAAPEPRSVSVTCDVPSPAGRSQNAAPNLERSSTDLSIPQPGRRVLSIRLSVMGALRLAVAIYALDTGFKAVYSPSIGEWQLIVCILLIFLTFIWDLVSGLLALRLRLRANDNDDRGRGGDSAERNEVAVRANAEPEEGRGDRRARRHATAITDGVFASLLLLFLLLASGATRWSNYPWSRAPLWYGAIIRTSFLM